MAGCTPSGGADGGPSVSTSLGATSTTTLAVTTSTAPGEPPWIEVRTLPAGGGFTIPDYAANPSECFDPSRPAQVAGIDADTGVVLWETPVPYPYDEQLLLGDSLIVMPVPEGWGRPPGFVALDTTGRPLWEASTEWSLRRMPIAAGHSLIMALTSQGGSAVAALDARTGEPRWFTPVDDAVIWNPLPSVSHTLGLVFVANSDDTVSALEIESGEIAWSRQVGQMSDGPVLAESGLFVVADGYLVSLDPVSGMTLWAATEDDDSTMLHDVLSAGDGTVLVVGEDERTISDPEVAWFTVSAFDTRDGSKLWEVDAFEWPVAGESTLLIHPTPPGLTGWSVDGIDRATGLRLWRLDNGGYASLRTATLESDTALLSTLTTLSVVVIDSPTGQVRLRVLIEGEPTAPPLIRPDRILIGTRVSRETGAPTGSIVSVDPADGSIAWSQDRVSPIQGTPMQLGDTIVALVSEDAYFCA